MHSEWQNGPMKFVAIIILSIIVGAVVGYSTGLQEGRFQAKLEECKMLRIWLTDSEIVPKNAITECLKARLYENIAFGFPDDSGYLRAQDWDAGKVNVRLMGGYVFSKGPHGPILDLASAIEKVRERQ